MKCTQLCFCSGWSRDSCCAHFFWDSELEMALWAVLQLAPLSLPATATSPQPLPPLQPYVVWLSNTSFGSSLNILITFCTKTFLNSLQSRPLSQLQLHWLLQPFANTVLVSQTCPYFCADLGPCLSCDVLQQDPPFQLSFTSPWFTSQHFLPPFSLAKQSHPRTNTWPPAHRHHVQ